MNERRGFLRTIGGGSLATFGAASLAGTGLFGLAGCNPAPSVESAKNAKNPESAESAKSTKSAAAAASNVASDAALRYPFYGAHQAGIVTPAQRHIYFLVLDLHTHDLAEIRKVFQDWTVYAARLTQGQNSVPYSDNGFVPPTDTGEADSLSAYGLTLTFGISPAFLKKLKLLGKAPPEFVELPKFPRDQIKAALSGGDICIQSCANDPQVAFHAVRQLVRHARSAITMRWSQAGFNAYEDASQTPRNLFAFKDGTANADTLKGADQHVWADSPDWLRGGSYLVARKVQMHIETWDRTSLRGQEETFGRHRESGAAFGQRDEHAAVELHRIPDVSHVHLAKKTGLQILRRSYSFASGIDSTTGQFDVGLMFVSFQKTPSQFIAVQSSLGRVDKMNEYTTHVGSGLFACFGGVQQGEFIGQALLGKAA